MVTCSQTFVCLPDVNTAVFEIFRIYTLMDIYPAGNRLTGRIGY